jgi:hypothetical protein
MAAEARPLNLLNSWTALAVAMTWGDLGYVAWPVVYGGLSLLALRWLTRNDKHAPGK